MASDWLETTQLYSLGRLTGSRVGDGVAWFSYLGSIEVTFLYTEETPLSSVNLNLGFFLLGILVNKTCCHSLHLSLSKNLMQR